uniref:Uncharacterized protein n=1 Tax=Strigamia maritima TaxID=126957 RepID=T1J6E9_STRMM
MAVAKFETSIYKISNKEKQRKTIKKVIFFGKNTLYGRPDPTRKKPEILCKNGDGVLSLDGTTDDGHFAVNEYEANLYLQIDMYQGLKLHTEACLWITAPFLYLVLAVGTRETFERPMTS